MTIIVKVVIDLILTFSVEKIPFTLNVCIRQSRLGYATVTNKPHRPYLP